MSGDLKDPARALPRGAFAALLVGYAAYMAIPVFLHFRIEDSEALLRNTFIIRDMARWGNLIVLGIWGASLSSAMGALLGGPRTLQALARDGVLPRVIGRGHGAGNDPRLATLITFGIALAGILAGGIDLIAPVLSMFFLTSYGALNLSSGLETLIGTPSWRPSFKVHWTFSMMGALACLGVMIMISPGAAIMATAFCAGIFLLLKRRRLRAHWGDLQYGLWMALARWAIYRLAEARPDEHSWKPNLLVLSGVPTKRWYLIELAAAIGRRNCLTTTALVLPEDATNERVRTARDAIRDYLKRRDVRSLVKVTRAPEVMPGLLTIINTYGFGPISPNTILIGDTEETEQFMGFTRLIMAVWRRQRNFVFVRQGVDADSDEPAATESGNIELWWQGKGPNAWFMLTLAHLLSMNPQWANAGLRLNTIIRSEEERETAEKRLQQIIQEARLDAEQRVILHQHGSVYDNIREHAQDARICFLGLRPPADDETEDAYAAYYQQLLKQTRDFPLTAFCLAHEQVAFDRIFLYSD